jgi:hypothetical protein
LVEIYSGLFYRPMSRLRDSRKYFFVIAPSPRFCPRAPDDPSLAIENRCQNLGSTEINA